MNMQRNRTVFRHAAVLAAIDDYIRTQMQIKRLPGLALGIVKGNQVIHVRGFGMADPTGRPVTPQTPFIIGSITKSFTALAIMQLVEEGKIELDAAVQRYIPWFRLADPEAADQITVRHLLNHTSGISRYVGRELLAGKGDGTLEQRVHELGTVSISQPIGVAFQYSNANYLVLGLVIQVVSGQSYEEYIQQHIFALLEMRHSFVSEGKARQDGMATGYRWWFGIPFPADLPYLSDALPAGFILSCAEDMTHYLIAHMNSGRYGESFILSPAGIAEMHRPETVVVSPDARYGIGWLTESVNGVTMLTHSGDTANFHADIIILPESQWGIIVLTNANNALAGQVEAAGKLGMGRIAAGVASLLEGHIPPTARLDFGAFYLTFNLALSLLTFLQLWSLVRLLQRWRQPLQRQPLNLVQQVALPLVWELALPLKVCTSLPRWSDAPWSILKLYVPDLAYWLFVMVPLSFTTGMLRVVRASLRLRL